MPALAFSANGTVCSPRGFLEGLKAVVGFGPTYEGRIADAVAKVREAEARAAKTRGVVFPRVREDGRNMDQGVYQQTRYEQAGKELNAEYRNFLEAVFAKAGSQGATQDKIFKGAQGASCHFVTSKNVEVPGRLVAVYFDHVEIVQYVDGKPTLRSLRFSELNIGATRLDIADSKPAEVAAQVAAINGEEDAAKKAREKRDIEILAAQQRAHEASSPKVDRVYRPGVGHVAVLTLPESNPGGYLRDLQKWVADANDILPEKQKISDGFLVQVDPTHVELHYSAVPAKAQAYVDDAIHEMTEDGLSKATTHLQHAKEEFGKAEDREIEARRVGFKLWRPEFDTEGYIRVGGQMKIVPIGKSPTHGGFQVVAFDDWETQIDGRRARVRMTHLTNRNGFVVGKEAIVNYLRPDGQPERDAAGHEVTEFYSTGTHVNDPRPGQNNSCKNCHNQPGGHLDPSPNPVSGIVMPNLFRDTRSLIHQIIQNVQDAKPWHLGP